MGFGPSRIAIYGISLPDQTPQPVKGVAMEYPGSGGFGDPGILARVGTYPRGVRNRVFSRVPHPFWTTFWTPNMA